MPKFKSQPSFETSDVYLQKIVELYPELQDAVFIDSTQYDLYSVNHVKQTYIHSILNNIPVVGLYYSDDVVSKNKHIYYLYYEFYNVNTETHYEITFKKEIAPNISANYDNTDNPYNLSEIATSNIHRMNIKKKILKNDTLVELSNKDGDRYYTLKKENGSITRLIKFDYNSFHKTLNEIWIASPDEMFGDHFEVTIETKFIPNLRLFLPVYEGKTTELNIDYKNNNFKTIAVVSDNSNLSEICNPDLHNPNSTCHFELTAPFENCNLKLDVEFKDNAPKIYIKNDITQLMQCLNIW